MGERLDEVFSVLQRYEREPEHVQQVCRLALMLFDQLEELHKLKDNDREVLEAAALLHDIGWSQTPLGGRHHKIAYKLIRERPWKLWDDREVELIANVARYHRKAHPNDSHKPFARLRPADQSRVLRLSALLRLADALDRGHRGAVLDLRCKLDGKRVTLEAKADTDLAAERGGLPRKALLFQEVYGREVRLA
jgi:exopolyphosphatase/guanosine-5'-triphosphate,3'-diphosphate pyrophosphatase